MYLCTRNETDIAYKRCCGLRQGRHGSHAADIVVSGYSHLQSAHGPRLPTALVSNTLDYGKFNIQDTTEYIRGTLPVWKELGFGFDAICTGLMFSEEQAKLVAGYCREQGEQSTTVFVDPILGDGGRLYNGMTERQVELAREMVSVADLTFPNYTEACYLTNTPIKMDGISWEEAGDLLDDLREIGCKSALITSCKIDGQNAVCGYNHYDDTYFHLNYHEIPGLFHGTGDIFSAVLIGSAHRSSVERRTTEDEHTYGNGYSVPYDRPLS